MAAVTGVAWWRSIEAPGTEAEALPERDRLPSPVLPLVDMRPAGGNEYLGDGLSEELSARLAQIPGCAWLPAHFGVRIQGSQPRRPPHRPGARRAPRARRQRAARS